MADRRKKHRGRRGGKENRLSNGSSSGSGGGDDQLMDLPQHRYRRGAIRRIKMHNFLTYTDAEVEPGAKLNIVVGPNGTGKSSIVCAICLCLGGKTVSLERAKEYKDFVKKGTQEGYVEVELHQTEEDSKNSVIRMDITNIKAAKTNPARWRLNGVTQQKKKIQELAAKHGIQVDNLCCFLAQDRVVQFASLDPIKLLQETEKAVNPRTFKLHQELMESKKRELQLNGQTEEKKKTLQQHIEEKKSLEQEVKRMQERDVIEEKIETLQKKVLWLDYVKAKDNERRAKDEYNRATEEEKRVRESQGPLREEEAKAKETVDSLARKGGVLTRTLKNMVQRRNQIIDTLQTLEARVDDKRAEIDGVENEVKEREMKKEKLSQLVEKLNEKLEECPSQDEINEEKKPLQQECMKLSRDRRENNKRKETIVHKVHVKKAELQRAERELNALGDTKYQRLAKGGRLHIKIRQLIEKNRHRFKGQIYGPIYNEISVAHPLHDKFLRNALGSFAFFYVVENGHDWQNLPRIVRRELNANVNVISIEDAAMEQRRRGANLERLHQFGVDGWLDGIVQGHPKVVQAMRVGKNIDRIAYAMKPISQQGVERVMKKQRNGEGVSILYNCNDNISVRFSDYDPNDYCFSEQALRDPRELLLMDEKNGDASRINDLIRRLRGEIERLNLKRDDVDREGRNIDGPLKAVTDKLNDLKREAGEATKIRVLLDKTKRELKLIEEEYSPQRVIQRFHEEIDRYNLTRFKKLRECHKLNEKWVDQVEEHEEVVMERAQADETYRNLRERLSQYDEELASKTNLVREMKEALQQAHKTKAAKKTMAKREAPLKKWKTKITAEWICELQLDEAKSMIRELELQLEGMMEDRSAFERYQELERLIGEYSRDTEAKEGELKSVRDSIEEKKQLWFPEIKKMAETVNKQYSKHFSDMGCEGAIKICEHEEFDKYGLEIWVKFREKADLQKLSKFTQSGGERSVSTMLFLLCLQTVTETPFRVVDEINQGMDAKNERMIFDRIVASCAAHNAGPKAPQYFLVTPKILPNLNYPEGADISVLCVYNGIGMVPREQWSMKSILDNISKSSRKRKV